MKSKAPKEKVCKSCGKIFIPTYSTLQRVCSTTCSLNATRKHALKQREKESKKDVAKMKEGLLTHKDYIQILQKVFNTFIRMRDKNNLCISCDTPMMNRKGDCSHFYPTTYQYLRFNEDNCHLACVPCNQFKSGNLHEYTPRLEKKIGFIRLQQLHLDRHKRLELSIPELKEKIKYYKNFMK